MKLRLNQFCSLATSPSFQSWLYSIDKEIYRIYQRHMKISRGCADNKEVMEETLQLLHEANKYIELISFLRSNFPNVIEGEVTRPQIKEGEVFPRFNPNVLTYPRRKIISGKNPHLKRKVNSFLVDKVKSDYIIIGDTAYIEYLNKEDRHLADKIAPTGWLISQYRLKNQI